jgi:hypothetical protein
MSLNVLQRKERKATHLDLTLEVESFDNGVSYLLDAHFLFFGD